MNDEEDEPSGLAYTGGQYQTKCTLFAQAGAGSARILEANPRRLWVRIDKVTIAAANFYISPGPMPTGIAALFGQTLPIEFKWRDCPSVCAGEFYGIFSASITLIIQECIFTRG